MAFQPLVVEPVSTTIDDGRWPIAIADDRLPSVDQVFDLTRTLHLVGEHQTLKHQLVYQLQLRALHRHQRRPPVGQVPQDQLPSHRLVVGEAEQLRPQRLRQLLAVSCLAARICAFQHHEDRFLHLLTLQKVPPLCRDAVT
jgi:hypothetical protein